jgi:hypothetical protein
VCNTLLDGDSDMCPVCALKSALAPENHATATDLRFEHYEILKNEDQTLIELGLGSMVSRIRLWMFNYSGWSR